MFQNLGEVLVACQSPIQHAAIEAQIAGGVSVDNARMQEMGFKHDSLARVVSRHWKLPPHLASIWEPPTRATTVSTFARFGNDVTRLMALPTASARDAGMTLLLMRHGIALGLTEETVHQVWGLAVEERHGTFATLGLPSRVPELPLGGAA